MMTSRKNSIRMALQAGLVVALVAGASGVYADANAAKLREQRQQEIAGKSEADRARLQRNFKAFGDLPFAEQERLRQLDRELKEDARAGGGLRAVMDEYYNWLATLTPGQQQDLREITDPTRREIRVRELIKEQQEHVDGALAGRGFRSPPKLSAKDLAAILDVIERAMRDKHVLTPVEVQQLQSKKDLSRRVEIFNLAFRPRPAGPNPGQPWVSKEVVEEMLECISNEKLAAYLKAGQNMDRWWRLIGVIYAAIRAEYDTIRPKQEDIERYFLQLSSEQQDEIMRLPFDQQPQKLMQVYMTHMSETEPDSFPRPPQFPFGGARRGRNAFRPGMRGGSEQRGGDAVAPRRPAGGKKNDDSKDRPRNPQSTPE
jgi:hypothetical protein